MEVLIMSTNVVTSIVRSYTIDTAFISGEPMGDYYETAIRKGEHSWAVVNNSWTELLSALDVHNEWVKTILLNPDDVVDTMLAKHDICSWDD